MALVGNHISPSGSVKADGTQVNTIWGELAWQLGGREAFAIVATADADRTPPGEALHELLGAYAPAVILIDEWVAYARSLVGRDDLAGGTFDDQFTFAQSLTEAVKGTAGRAAGNLDTRVGERRRHPAGRSATPRRSAARTASRRSSACRTSCAAWPTSGARRPRTRPTTSSASDCSWRPTPTRSRRSTRRPAVSWRCTTATPTSSRARRATAATRTASSRPTRSTPSCSTDSMRTGRALSASSARAACCA